MFFFQRKKVPKCVSDSAIEKKIKLFPEQMSPHGVLFGSRLLEIADSYAKIAGDKHSNAKSRACGIEFVRFFSQVKRDDILTCKASVNRAWESFMEIGVKIEAEDFRNLEKKHILTAYFVYEAFDEEDNKIVLPYVVCENAEQIRRYNDALKRHRKNDIASEASKNYKS